MSLGSTVTVPRRLWKALIGSVARRRPVAPDLPSFDLEVVSRSVVDGLQQRLGNADLALLLPDPQDGTFRVWASRGYGGAALSLVRFACNSPLVDHFSASPVDADYDRLKTTPWFKSLSKEETESLDTLKRGSFRPLSIEARLVGLLVLGRSRSRASGPSVPTRDELGRIALVIDEVLLHHRLKEAHRAVASGGPRTTQGEEVRRLEQNARNVGHDLSNILASILSHAQLLEDQEWSREVRRRGAAIRQSVLDGAESTRGLWDLSARQEISEAFSVEVNEIVTTTLHTMEPQWRLGYISHPSVIGRRFYARLEAEDAPLSAMEGPPPRLLVTLNDSMAVSGGPTDLRRALSNILFNAVDALPSQGGHIDITSRRDGRWAVIGVRDNGAGMSRETLKRIFEPFFTTKGTGGNGFGLNICQEIVTRHGGRLEVESGEGTGSTFTVVLPMADSPEPGG